MVQEGWVSWKPLLILYRDIDRNNRPHLHKDDERLSLYLQRAITMHQSQPSIDQKDQPPALVRSRQTPVLVLVSTELGQKTIRNAALNAARAWYLRWRHGGCYESGTL